MTGNRSLTITTCNNGIFSPDDTGLYRVYIFRSSVHTFRQFLRFSWCNNAHVDMSTCYLQNAFDSFVIMTPPVLYSDIVLLGWDVTDDRNSSDATATISFVLRWIERFPVGNRCRWWYMGTNNTNMDWEQYKFSQSTICQHPASCNV